MNLSKTACLRWIVVVSMAFGFVLPWTPKAFAHWLLLCAYLFAASFGYFWFTADTQDDSQREEKAATWLLKLCIWVLPLLFLPYYYVSRRRLEGLKFVGKFFIFYLANIIAVVLSTGLMTVLGEKIASIA